MPSNWAKEKPPLLASTEAPLTRVADDDVVIFEVPADGTVR